MAPSVFAFNDIKTPFCVNTGASGRTLGFFLAQKKEDSKIHPMYYANRTFNYAEKKYSTSEREALAVIFVVKKFRVYLL